MLLSNWQPQVRPVFPAGSGEVPAPGSHDASENFIIPVIMVETILALPLPIVQEVREKLLEKNLLQSGELLKANR
jgi:hypothetical protein